MRGDDRGELPLRARRRGRCVGSSSSHEHAAHQAQPRQGQSPALASREELGWIIREAPEIEARECGIDIAAAQIVAPEGEVFLDRQRRLDRLAMGNEMAVLADGQIFMPPVQLDCSGIGAGKTGDEAQQGCLAGAVGPGQRQQLPGFDGKTHPGKEEASAPLAGDIVGAQFHG